jgi:hypothetical protein
MGRLSDSETVRCCRCRVEGGVLGLGESHLSLGPLLASHEDVYLLIITTVGLKYSNIRIKKEKYSNQLQCNEHNVGTNVA